VGRLAPSVRQEHVPVSSLRPPTPPAFADMRVGAHHLTLLRDGVQAFPAMLDAIAAARGAVCMETYILRDDRTGRRFGEAMAERARAGVEVSLIYDAWGSSVSSDYIDRLEAAGVRTLVYHPVRFDGSLPAIAARLTRRDHRKALIVDGKVAFLGGLNLNDDDAPVEEGGAGWRDTHLRIEGPAAAELEFFFRHTWRREHGAPFDEQRYDHPSRRADPLVRVITSDLRRTRHGIREEYRAAIHAARSRIAITNAYFLPTRRILRGLADAARRGVEVRVMTAGTTDVPAVLLASRSVYERLLDAGVRLYEWRGRVLHAKTAVIDGHWSTVGSLNLDQQSLRYNLEANAFVNDAGFADALTRMFDVDLAHCVEIDPVRWRKRAPWERAASWAAFQLNRWL
jgi:cardiolipin synthase A/B